MVKNLSGTPKISVIIPVYNRESLCVETLKSIIKQTYKNWECLVVDDHSTDKTYEVVEKLSNLDTRIKIYKRPNTRTKGANACRNFGFEKCQGQFIIWFDSDDLMTPTHIEEKVAAIVASNTDFVIARTANFEGEQLLEPYQYEKKSYGIKAADFVLSKIHWYTYDVMLKKEIATQISWNEEMKSWQDYNYFCKMLLITENGIYLDEVLTHRRLHAISIQKKLLSTPTNFQNELLENRLLTFYDIEKQMDSETRREMIYALMNHGYELGKLRSVSKMHPEILQVVKKHLGLHSAVLFATSVLTAFVSGKGYVLLEKSKKRTF